MMPVLASDHTNPIQPHTIHTTAGRSATGRRRFLWYRTRVRRVRFLRHDGTLTCNIMQFRWRSINNQVFGIPLVEAAPRAEGAGQAFRRRSGPYFGPGPPRGALSRRFGPDVRGVGSGRGESIPTYRPTPGKTSLLNGTLTSMTSYLLL